MNTAKIFVGILMILTAIKVNGQSDTKSRGLLQQEFIEKHYITPYLKDSGNMKITSTKIIDSLFTAIDNGWGKVAPDTLLKYKLKMPLGDFKHIDAYCYFWTLVSISQDLNLPLKYKRHLVRNYMIPAMQHDFSTLKQRPDLTSVQLIHSGTLQNTLTIGSDNEMDKETTLLTYQLYASFKGILSSLTKSTDTAIVNYSKNQLKGMERFKYDLNAKFNYYNGRDDESLNDVIKGLSTNEYPRSRVFSMSKMLLNNFISSGKKDKSLKLLNTLTLNTTSDNINRDTLLNWYLKVDPLNGKKAFDHALSPLSGSSNKKTGKSIQLPVNWNFINNLVASERTKKVKYYFVDVWYTSCGPCILEIPDLNAFNDKFKNRDDVQFISINTDFINGKLDEAYVVKLSKELSIQFPVVYDNANSNITGKLLVTSYPSKFIIDHTGQIITKTDNSEMTLEAFEMFISELK
jgi:thiol-disulfide isomerase/thioredoxin